MERRDRSLKALEELRYINSLDPSDRARSLIKWVEKYLPNEAIFNFELELDDLEILAELFYSNISFLKEHKENTRQEILKNRDLEKFLKH